MQLSASVEKKEKKNMTQKYVGIHTPSKRHSVPDTTQQQQEKRQRAHAIYFPFFFNKKIMKSCLIARKKTLPTKTHIHTLCHRIKRQPTFQTNRQKRGIEREPFQLKLRKHVFREKKTK